MATGHWIAVLHPFIAALVCIATWNFDHARVNPRTISGKVSSLGWTPTRRRAPSGSGRSDAGAVQFAFGGSSVKVEGVFLIDAPSA